MRRRGPTEIDPTNVRAVSITGEIAIAVMVHTKIRSRIRVVNAIVRIPVTETDPTKVRSIGFAGKIIVRKGDTFRRHRLIMAEIDPTAVRAVGIFGRGIEVTASESRGYQNGEKERCGENSH